MVVSHSNGVYRMYSLPWIIEHYTVVKATLGQYLRLTSLRAGVVGEAGFGVPLTIEMTGVCVSILISVLLKVTQSAYVPNSCHVHSDIIMTS